MRSAGKLLKKSKKAGKEQDMVKSSLRVYPLN